MSTQVAVPAAAHPARGRRRRSDRHAKYVFLLPALAYLVILGVVPLVFSLYLVFGSWQAGTKEISWVGLYNIRRLVEDTRFWNAFRLTLVFVALVAGLELLLGFVIALALQADLRGKNGLRLLFAVPMLLPPIAVSLTWKMLFDFQKGPINYGLERLGLDGVQWLAGRPESLFALAIVDVWQWTPFIALAVLAALESMPPELYEAGTVDGASPWNLLRDITLPLIQPYVVAVVLLRSIDAFKIFDSVYVLTGGGPGTSTEVLSFYAYVAGYKVFNMGFTATVSWALVLTMTVIFLLFLRVFRRLEDA